MSAEVEGSNVAVPGMFQARLGWDVHLTPHDQSLWKGVQSLEKKAVGSRPRVPIIFF